ncbi:hypothetical protein QMT25_20665 [Cronobacter dublinensis]|uniref:hypothetical protein n=1 Tax=Cronobacter dublinensis TaxID=413497 RepID=UPI0024C44148|nr:hypothetical protein [Cronobacter dublinensis]MDK1199353.1 hypothetical protein [Cronobacter dublinensis]
MKLIDLLVQQLPKRGGWPDGVYVIEQGSEGYLLEIESDYKSDFRLQMADDWLPECVTRDQYEAALAAAQKPVWDGEGLPPVGCECEARYRDAANAEWFFFRCVGVDCGIAFGWAGKEAVTLGKGSFEFRPIRSEAEDKRAAGVTSLAKAGGAVDFEYGRKTIDGELSAPGWYELYDRIAAGEVAGIRIE